MNERARIYGKVVNTWKATEQCTDRSGKKREREVITQYEVEYTEYNKDGSIYRKGTEDFSRERYNMIQNKWVYTWDGHQLNRGGKRKFEDQGMIKYSRLQWEEVKSLLKHRYPDAACIQLR